MEQLTKEQAIKFYESKKWKKLTLRQRAEFQIQQKRLCMPFNIFHEAVEKTLERPVYTHEFGFNVEGLKAELFKKTSHPTFKEIIDMIPKAKEVFILEV